MAAVASPLRDSIAPNERLLSTEATLAGLVPSSGVVIETLRRTFADSEVPEERINANVAHIISTPEGRRSAIEQHRNSAPGDFIQLTGKAAETNPRRLERFITASVQVARARDRAISTQKAQARVTTSIHDAKERLNRWQNRRDLQ